MNITKPLLVILASITVAACGGGSGSSGPVGSVTIGGVAGVNNPIANGAVQIICAGGGPLSTSTDSTGVWQVTISGQTPPCAVEVSGGTINDVANSTPYHSIATSFGTVNVTPLSDLVLANLAGTATPNIWFADLTPAAIASITLSSVNASLANQCAALSGLPPLCTTNPITTVFTPTSGNALYNMVVALQMAMLNSGVTYTSLLSNASVPTYTAPDPSFNTALTTAYVATTATISASAITTAKSLTVGVPITSFSPIIPTGGTTPYAYSYAGTLPAGLSFSTSTGAVTGTPSATYATANLVFSVKDANHVVAGTTSTVSITVGAATVNISATANSTAQSLTVGIPMTSFSPLLPSGGTAPYTYSYAGNLPTGLSFSTSTSTGAVTGTPNVVYATANVVFSVKDANNVVASTTSTVSFTVAATTGSWTATGSTAIVRSGHTATVLPSGKVLVAGGANIISGGPASAELYDPGTGQFAATGTMATVKYQHTATLLSGGNVLITGGTNLTGGLASAELYDPTTGLFTVTGSMTTARANHTATLLPNNKVLVVGGAIADLYDPATGLFTTTTGSMAAARTQHAATLLPNGKVLIIGGVTASAELYDPATGLFTPAGSMATARTSLTATLLPSGKVLVAGGLGGLATALLYDPATSVFAATGNMATATGRFAHTATLLPSGKVLITGGTENAAVGTNRTELYDPATGIFTFIGSTTAARIFHTATLLPSGKVLAAGGAFNVSAELYQ